MSPPSRTTVRTTRQTRVDCLFGRLRIPAFGGRGNEQNRRLRRFHRRLLSLTVTLVTTFASCMALMRSSEPSFEIRLEFSGRVVDESLDGFFGRGGVDRHEVDNALPCRGDVFGPEMPMVGGLAVLHSIRPVTAKRACCQQYSGDARDDCEAAVEGAAGASAAVGTAVSGSASPVRRPLGRRPPCRRSASGPRLIQLAAKFVGPGAGGLGTGLRLRCRQPRRPRRVRSSAVPPSGPSLPPLDIRPPRQVVGCPVLPGASTAIQHMAQPPAGPAAQVVAESFRLCGQFARRLCEAVPCA